MDDHTICRVRRSGTIGRSSGRARRAGSSSSAASGIHKHHGLLRLRCGLLRLRRLLTFLGEQFGHAGFAVVLVLDIHGTFCTDKFTAVDTYADRFSILMNITIHTHNRITAPDGMQDDATKSSVPVRKRIFGRGYIPGSRHPPAGWGRNVSYVETSEYPLWVNGYEAFSFSGALAVIDSRYEEGSRDHIPPNYMKSSDPRDPINYAIELLAYFHWLRDEFEQHIWTAKTVGQIPVSQVSFSYKPYTQAAGTYLADTEFEQRYGQWAIMFRQSLSVELDVYQWYREQGKVRLTEQQRRELILRERRRAELWMDLMYDGSADPDILEQAIAEMDALVEDFARNGYDVEKVTAYNQRYRRENIAIGNIAAPTCRPGSFTPGTITCREERIGEGARLSVERRYIVAYDPVERLELDIHDFPVVDLLYPSFLQIGLEAAAEVPLVIDIQQCRAYAEKVQKSWKPWPTTTSAAPVPSTRRQTTRSGWFTDETGA